MNPLPNCGPVAPSDHRITIYSGHDYTLLTLFGLLRAMTSMESSVGFASYVIFELWDNKPSDGTDPAAKYPRLEEDTRVLRIKYNSNPFYSKSAGKITPGEVQVGNETVLREYTMPELNELLGFIREELSAAGGNACASRLDSGVRALKECHTMEKLLSPTPTPCSPNGTYNPSGDMKDLDMFIMEQSGVINPASEDNG